MRIKVIWRIAMLAAVLPALAAADPITIDFTRFVSGNVAIGIAGADEFEEFSDEGADVLASGSTLSVERSSARAGATLSSRLSTDSRRVTATGSTSATAHSVGSASGTAASARGSANVWWSFRLNQPHLFTLSGSFAASPAEFTFPRASRSGLLNTTLHSTSADGTVIELFSQSTAMSGAVSHTGRLGHGVYFFVWEAGANAGHNSTFGARPPGPASAAFAFVFDLAPDTAPVPEPGSMLLLGTSLSAAVVALRTRKQGSKR